MDLDRLIAFYQELTPESVQRFSEFYSADAYFKDPFNEVRGAQAIAGIFDHMFHQVEAPRFVVIEHAVGTDGVMLVWDFSYRVRFWGQGKTQVIHGVSHLKFDADGKINYHRDYWDAAEELYMKLPFIGRIIKCLKQVFTR